MGSCFNLVITPEPPPRLIPPIEAFGGRLFGDRFVKGEYKEKMGQADLLQK